MYSPVNSFVAISHLVFSGTASIVLAIETIFLRGHFFGQILDGSINARTQKGAGLVMWSGFFRVLFLCLAIAIGHTCAYASS
jgi:hypothetical protein